MSGFNYDLTELGNYIAKQRGEGLVPEFTNIAGASGFYMEEETPAQPEAPAAPLPPLDSFTTREEATLALNTALKNREGIRFARKQELQKELGIQDMKDTVASWKAQGLSTSPLVAEREALIIEKQQQVSEILASEDATKELLEERQYLRDLQSGLSFIPTASDIEAGIDKDTAFEAATEKAAINSARMEAAALGNQDKYDQVEQKRLEAEYDTPENRSLIAEIQERRFKRQEAKLLLEAEVRDGAVLLAEKQAITKRAKEIEEITANESKERALALLSQQKDKNSAERTKLAEERTKRLKTEQAEIKDRLANIQTTQAEIKKRTEGNTINRNRRKVNSILYKYGVGDSGVRRLEAVTGGEISEEYLQKLPEDTAQVLKLEQTENRTLNMQDIVKDYEGNIPFFLAEQKLKMPKEAYEIAAKETIAFQKEIQKVKREPVTPTTEETRSLSATGANNAARNRKINNAIVTFDKQFKAKYLEIKPLASITTLTELEKKALGHPTIGNQIKQYLAMAIDPAVPASRKRGLYNFISLNIGWTDLDPAFFASTYAGKQQFRSILRKIAEPSITEFNAKYSDTMGVTANNDDLIFFTGAM